MKNKSNEATVLRPEGDRILNAPLVEMDLNKFIVQLKQETTWTTSDHNAITVFKSAFITIVLIGMRKNAELKKHTTYGNINILVLDGKISFTAEQQTRSLEKGQMIALEADIKHSVLALKESFILLTMIINNQSL